MTAIVLLAALLASGGRSDAAPLWALGLPDGGDAEFGLAPDGFRRYSGDGLFVVGRSDASRDWPYVHPGPSDGWAGAKPHRFVVAFDLASAPRSGECSLEVRLVDTHASAPPKLTLSLNGVARSLGLPAGAGDESVEGRPQTGRPYRFEVVFPASALKDGLNMLSIATVEGSWCLYDSLAFRAPEGAALGPAPEAVVDGGVPETPCAVFAGGRRPVRWRVWSAGEGSAELRVEGLAPQSLRLAKGVQQVEVRVPESASGHAYKLLVGGKVAEQGRLSLPPVPKLTFFFLPHSHNDIGYSDRQAAVERQQWSYIDQAVDLARQTRGYPEGARFKWNIEMMWPVRSYLRQASPERREAFEEAVKRGDVGLEAFLAGVLTPLCRPEECYALIEESRRLSAELGVPVDTAMITDIPGFTWGLNSVLADGGIKMVTSGINNGDRIGFTLSTWGDRPFFWRTPDGRGKVLFWAAGTGYASFHDGLGGPAAKRGDGWFLDYARRLAAEQYPYRLVQLRYTIRADNGPTDPTLPGFVKDWNERYEWPKMAIGTSRDLYREMMARHAKEIPTYAGDLTGYWEDGAASSARELATNRESAERLSQAEALWAMLRRPAFPSEAAREAWSNVVLFDEHTWGAYNSVSEPESEFAKDQWRVKQAFALDGSAQATKLMNEAVGERPSPVEAVDVANTASWPRTGLVTIARDLPLAGDRVVGPDGNAVASQRLSTGELAFVARDVPAFGFARYRLVPGVAGGSGDAVASGLQVRSGLVEARIDPATGAVSSLRAAGKEWVDSKAAVALNDYRYVAGRDSHLAVGPGKPVVTVKEKGPVVASLMVESAAPGCNILRREVRVVSGLDRLDLIDTLDKQDVRDPESVHIGFGLNVPDATLRAELPFSVARLPQDQLPGSCGNFVTVQRWIDASNADGGVTLAPVDAPLFELGSMTGEQPWTDRVKASPTLYSYAMNNYWHTNYRASQGGVTTLRYALRPHGEFDALAAARFGVESSQPLVAIPASGEPRRPLLGVSPGEVVADLKPGEGGQGWTLRLFGASGMTKKVRIAWPGRLERVDGRGRVLGKIDGAVDVPAWGIVTVRGRKTNETGS